MGNCLGCRCVEDDSDIEQYYHHSGYGGGGAQGGGSRPLPNGGGGSRPLSNGDGGSRPLSNGGGGSRPLPNGDGGRGSRPLPNGGGGSRPLSNGDGGSRPLSNGGGGSRPLPNGDGGGGSRPLPNGGGGSRPLSNGDGGGGSRPLPNGDGGGGSRPLPNGDGGGGSHPLPNGGGGSRPLPNGDGGGGSHLLPNGGGGSRPLTGGGGSHPLPNGGVVITKYHTVVGYTAVARDLIEFEYTNKVPSGLDDYVLASKATQKDWYAKILRAWKRANPPPTSDEGGALLIIETLLSPHHIQGLLRFYRLPCPTAQTIQHVPNVSEFEEEEFDEEEFEEEEFDEEEFDEEEFEETEFDEEEFEEETDGLRWPPVISLQDVSEVTESEDEEEEEEEDEDEEDKEDDDGLEWPEGVRYEIHTLPVKEETVGDGDGFTVFVDVYKDARETANLPLEIKDAVKQRRIARNQKNFNIADDLREQIEKENYKVCDGKNGGAPSLLRKYKIRLRGVDAPEVGPGIGQPHGEEAKVRLRELVKDQELLIHVYNTDPFGREVGDIYCNGVFIQEVLLKEGMVWYFEKHDNREAFAKWERNAKAARLGLWRDDNPEAPWTYRKRNKRGRSFKKRGA